MQSLERSRETFNSFTYNNALQVSINFSMTPTERYNMLLLSQRCIAAYPISCLSLWRMDPVEFICVQRRASWACFSSRYEQDSLVRHMETAKIPPAFPITAFVSSGVGEKIVGVFWQKHVSRGHARLLQEMHRLRATNPVRFTAWNSRGYVRVAETTGAARTAHAKRMPRFKCSH